jgi:predicted dehydrogenase
MSGTAHHVLVIGGGSIGERHVRTLLATKRCTVVACDPNPTIRNHLATAYGVAAVPNWETAVDRHDIFAVVIATPAPLHVAMTLRALETGRHVLVEKPLSTDLADAAQLPAARDRAGKFAAVAYVHHAQPALQAARNFIRTGGFGPVRHAQVSTGHHFPTARPAYREIYYRDHAQGGGAIQDALTHMANCIEWVLGPTDSLFCDAAHQALDGVEVEDTVHVLARNGGALVTYGLNQFQAPTETRIDFHAPGGSVRIEYHRQRWGTLALGAKDWQWHVAPVPERDSLYIAQVNAFLDGCEGKPNPLCTLEEGLQTLRFNLAALRAWRTRQPVTLQSL